MKNKPSKNEGLRDFFDYGGIHDYGAESRTWDSMISALVVLVPLVSLVVFFSLRTQ